MRGLLLHGLPGPILEIVHGEVPGMLPRSADAAQARRTRDGLERGERQTVTLTRGKHFVRALSLKGSEPAVSIKIRRTDG